MADLLSWLGSGIDKIIPGDQSFLHPQKPQPAPVSNASRSAGASIGQNFGYGNSNPAQPYSPPMARPAPINLSSYKVQAQPPQPSFGQKALGVAGNVGNMLLGDVNHLAKVISYPINTAQYQDMLRKGQITQEQASQLINQAGNDAGFNIQDKGGTVLRKTAGAVAMPTATILTAGAAPEGLAALKGLSLGARVLKGAKTVAPIGAGFGAIQTLGQKDPITAQDAALNIGGGALGGALLGGATPVVGAGAKVIGKSAVQGAESLVKQVSKLSKNVAEKGAPKLPVKPISGNVAQSLPQIKDKLSINEAAQQFGKDAGIVNTKPAHQVAIENALNQGDLATVGKIIKTIPDGDPYKQSMMSLFKGRIPALNSEAGSVNLNAKIGGKDPAQIAEKEYDRQINAMVNKGMGDKRLAQPRPDFTDPKVQKQYTPAPKLPAKKVNNFVPLKQQAAAKAPKVLPTAADTSKVRGLTKGIKGSPNFSPELQAKVESKYTPFTDKEALASNEKFMKQGLNKANKQAIATLSDKKSNIGKQEVVNFGKTIQELDAKGRTDEATAIHDLLAERLTRAGQTSQAAKLLYNRTPEGLRNMAFRDLRNAKVEITPELKAEVEGHIKAIKSLPNGEAKNFAIAVMQKSIAKHLPQEKIGQAVSVWKAGLLSGVKTQGGNFESNLAFGMAKKASDPLATGIDKLISLKTGQRTKALTMKGIASGTKEGFKKGLITMKTGIDMRNIDKYEQHAELNFGSKWMNRLIATPSNFVFRGMSAADQPFWYAGLKNSLYDQAKADGINLGLKGKALTDHMNQLVQNPTEKMTEVGLKEANKSTLAYDTLGFKAISGLHSGIDNSGFSKSGKDAAHALVNILAPFTKVPTAFLSRTVDFTPLGPIKEVLSEISHKQFDQRQLSQAIAEGVTGTGMIAIGMNLAHQRLLSGDYPKNDAKEQARWRTEHITANSVKLGGTWISLNYMGPIGLLFNAGNQMVQAEKNGAGAYEKAGAALAGLGQGLLGQSFLQGFSGFSDAIKDPEQNLSKWIYSQAGSVVPNLINDGRNLVDGMQRQVNSAGDAIINKLPGFSNHLPAKVGAFGEDLPNNSSGFSSLNPLKPSDSVDSPLLSELNRLSATGSENAVFPVADKNFGSGKDLVKLTPAQVTQRQKLVGAQIKPLWEQITTSPGYAQLDDAHKAQALKNALTDVNSAVTRTMQAQIAPALNSKPATGNTALILGGHAPGADSYINKAAASGSGTSGQTPAQKYLTNLTNYKNAVAAGTLSGPKRYATEQSLAKEAITSKYSQDVLDFYAMSKTEAANYFNSNPAQAQALYDQAKQLDAQLGGTKYKYGLAAKPKKAKVAKLPKSYTSTKLDKLVSGLKVSYKAPKLPKLASAKTASIPKPKASGIKVTKGKTAVAKPQPIKVPKVPGFKGFA